jgi:hypothetical protein
VPEPAAVTDVDDKPWSIGVSVEDRRASRELFLEGNRLFRVPLFARAATQYLAALRKWKHPAFYFNLALAQINLDQEVEARENLERALKYGAEPLGVDEHKEAQRQFRLLERQLGRVRISCKIRGAEVTLDGVKLFTGPGSYEGWVKAEDHELTAKKSGYLSEARAVTVAAGKLEDVELHLITLDEASDQNRRWATWKPWAVVAAGSAVAIGGGVMHSLSAKNFSTYDDAFLRLPCVTDAGSTGCNEEQIGAELNDQLDRARLQQRLAIGAYAAGGAILATGAVLIYMNRPRTLEQESVGPAPDRLSLIPDLGADRIGVVLSVIH